MSFRRELRALRYIERGDVLRLKSYLRKHRHLRLDEPLPGAQSLLHTACALGGDACALLLLRKGADPLRTDAAGNNALHVASREAEKGRKNVYTDLVVPILQRCPRAIDAQNLQGTTPRDILRRAEAKMETPLSTSATPRGSYSQSSSSDAEWQRKLLAESLDEYDEVFGQYEEDDFSQPPPETETFESFESWADRISQEYRARRRQAEQQTTRTCRASAGGTAREAEERTYQERRLRMETELRQSQSKRYQRRCQQVFGKSTTEQDDRAGDVGDKTDTEGAGSSGIRLLGYNDIPWPVPHGSAEQMAQAIAKSADSSDPTTYKRYLRAQQITWHPDRFMQRCSERLRVGEREQVLRTVTALSQELNRLANNAK
ncbi:NF-kappa-B inhibitor-like protein 1 isoform 1-T2 [Discoglossus pictus]